MAKDKKQGWQEERGLHAKAGKGEKAEGKGFHGHSEEHSKISKGEKTKNKGFFDKLK